MELGATICTPRAPKCLACPIRAHCGAQAAGLQEQIPLPKKAKPTPLLRRNIYCIRRNGEYLVEQRPAKGRWAGMWQFLTVDAGPAKAPAPLHASLSVKLSKPRRIGQVAHALTHRRYEFDVYACEVTRDGKDPRPRRWTSLKELDALPLPLPHVKVARMLRDVEIGAGSRMQGR
jgi:A/G-specific adenine glycosylase